MQFQVSSNIKKVFLLLIFSSICISQTVEIRNGWYYINDEKFFVKGIGYETNARPGQVPWNYSFDEEIIKYDLDRIKQAGFNTIRTWGALTEEELNLVQESGLKIIFGIWIDPHGDYGEQNFKNAALVHVKSVIEYSQNYNCIIGYLIMNEPIVDDIVKGGAENLSNLWNDIIELIHNNHAGVPVSFANSVVGDFIDMSRFDFAAYNAYIYNPKLFTDSHGYLNYLKFLKENRSPSKPMIITEFGLSVSPDFYSEDYSYGGNTLEQQTTGNLKMYRELIDAGLQGGCVFQYHDGWWKGGDENTHDETAEEWFGLIEFKSISDRFGTPRPFWEACSSYNRAIITEPKNGEIYSHKIPIEIFTTSDVSYFTISVDDSVYLSDNILAGYYNSEYEFNFEDELVDEILSFDFFNGNNELLKNEPIIILLSSGEVEMPIFSIEIVPKVLLPGGTNTFKMNLQIDHVFELRANQINYVMFSHIGWDPGIARTADINLLGDTWSLLDYFTTPSETRVTTYGAGVGVKFGDWQKTYSDQEVLIAGDWADPIKFENPATGYEENLESIPNSYVLVQNYPNPFNPTTKIKFTIASHSDVSAGGAKQSVTTLKVYDMLGREMRTLLNKPIHPGSYQIEFDGSSLSSGVYFYVLQSGDVRISKKMLLVK